MPLEDIRNERLEKLASYRKAGFDAYPATVGRRHVISEAHKNFVKFEKFHFASAAVGTISLIFAISKFGSKGFTM